MSEVKIVRLITGEDVIGQIDKDTVGNYTLNKAFTIIPTQSAPGQPVQLMMTPYMPFSADETVTISADKIVTSVKPKEDIYNSYKANTSKILTPNKNLITETKIPTL